MYSQCSVSSCSGTSISGASNYTIPASTTYYVASGNTWSGNVTFTDATSILCIEGTWTGKIAAASPNPGTINVRSGGVVNNASTWTHNGGGTVNININTGATFTITGFTFSGGTFNITNCGILTCTGSSSSNGGTITINNYGTIDFQGTFTNSGTGWTFTNQSGGIIKSHAAGTAFSFSAGTFVNNGNYCFENNIAYNGGTLTNNSCMSFNDFTTNTASGLTNNGIMKVNGNFTNSGAGQVNNGEINITGNFTNSGTITLGDKSYITCVNWTVNGTINGPASGTACMRMTGTSTFSGIFSSNSSRINAYDTGVPALTGSPAFRFDINTGNVGSATYNSSCTTNSYSDCGGDCVSILPIELLQFSGENNCDHNILSWATSTEINNDFFTLERSYDNHTFSTVGIVQAAGNSNTLLHYEFIDIYTDLQNKDQLYYRLKQTDYNGRAEYFGPILISTNCENSISIYPSVTHGAINIHAGQTQPNTTVLVTDIWGGKILSESLPDEWTNITLDLSGYSKGIYFICLPTNKEILVRKIVLQ